MIKRELSLELKTVVKHFPVVAVLGPRQSGKTTLVKATFSKYNYVTLEDLDKRELATVDPRSFLEANLNNHGLILDEIQFAPDLLSYIKAHVDTHQKVGQFILTGSQNFLLNEKIAQSLAGRVAILTLLPLSYGELDKASLLSEKIESALFTGFYPRIFDQNVPPEKWYKNYIKTYIERDVRMLKNVENLSVFQHFVKLCAGRIGQILNLSSLGNDCGVSANTARSWISVLESSYIIYLLRPHHKNFSKRLIKSPKLYFYDTGLACSLLEVDNAKQLVSHYARGNLFESFVISEIIKSHYNRDQRPNVYFWRDNRGNEVDCIIEKGQELTPIEVKFGKTINQSFFDGLNYWNNLAGDTERSFVVYGGDEKQQQKGISILGWRFLNDCLNFKN
jgi:predicted AAA+ superfamily ATPase